MHWLGIIINTLAAAIVKGLPWETFGGCGLVNKELTEK